MLSFKHVAVTQLENEFMNIFNKSPKINKIKFLIIRHVTKLVKNIGPTNFQLIGTKFPTKIIVTVNNDFMFTYQMATQSISKKSYLKSMIKRLVNIIFKVKLLGEC